MRNKFLHSAAALGIAIGMIYGGGQLLKAESVPMPYTVSGFAVGVIGSVPPPYTVGVAVAAIGAGGIIFWENQYFNRRV